MGSGYVHSVEVGSFVDGPGIRYVVFLAGCPLRCKYCHNPDAWQRPAEATDAASLLVNVARTAAFLRQGNGGVTVSGGEPLVQAEFAHEILRGAKELGLHTALDTSGHLGDRLTDAMLADIDLVLLDIKSFLPATYREVTGVEIEPTLRLAHRLAEACKPTWVRFVLVPGLTDEPENVQLLARFVGSLGNVTRVEVVPFHQMGRHKWEALCLPYELAETPSPTAEQIERAKAIFRSEGVAVDEGIFAPCASLKE